MKGIIRRLRWFLIIIILSIIFLIVFYLMANQPVGGRDYASVNIANRGIDLIMRRVRLVEKKGGQKEWELLAKKAEFDKSQNKMNLEDIKATFYPAGKKPIVVSSKRGMVDNKSKDIELNGDVLIKSYEGYKLSTEDIVWIASKRILTTDDFVKITGERFKITGNGFVSNIDTQDIKIKGGVEAVYY